MTETAAPRKRGPKPGTGVVCNAYENALEAWGIDMPDWVATLAHACDASSQSKVAKVIDYQVTVVSMVLRRKYPAPHHVEQAVRARLMGDDVSCPVEHSIPLERCRKNQEFNRHFRPTSEVRIQLYHACKTCPHARQNLKKEGTDHAE